MAQHGSHGARRAILNTRDQSGDWSNWHPVWVIAEHLCTWRIWSWRAPLTRLVHKHALGERVLPL
jgi:hypothetical protein